MLLRFNFHSSILQIKNKRNIHFLQTTLLLPQKPDPSLQPYLTKTFLKVDILLMFQISFQDYSPAVFIRNLTQQTIQPFASPAQTYDRDELRPLLMELFKWKEFEFMDVVNILGYGRDKYVKITLDELTDYIMERYLGETAINRYNRFRVYARQDENIMNKKEFLETLAMGLDFLQEFKITQFSKEFEAIFEKLDVRKVGTIPHVQYCRFLKFYLGSESPMAINPTKRVTELAESRQLQFTSLRLEQNGEEQYALRQQKIGESVQLNNKLQFSNNEIIAQSSSNEVLKLGAALEEFQSLIINSIVQKCRQYDHDSDQRLLKSECEAFLYDVLELQLPSIGFIISSYFNFSKNSTVSFAQMIQIVCEIHFRQILTTIIKAQSHIEIPSKILMEKEYFTSKILENCYFFQTPPTIQLLQRVFDEILLRSSPNFGNKITLDDFRSFILVHCCNNKFIFRHQSKKSTNTLVNPPASITQAENSHYQEDQSEASLPRSRREFRSSNQSASKSNEKDSKEHSMEGEIGLSSNKRTKTNKLSQESISIQNQLLPASFPQSSKEVNVSVIKGSSESIKLINQVEEAHSKQSIPIMKQKRREDKPFKQLLWDELEAIIFKYTVTEKGRLNKNQCDSLFNREAIFNEDRKSFIDKISRLFSKRVFVETELIASFIIHMKGEQALIQFNGKQIKGKSSLNQIQIAEILFNAYGKLIRLSKQSFQIFSNVLLAQNGKSLFQYKNYLELIARNLSIKNNF